MGAGAVGLNCDAFSNDLDMDATAVERHIRRRMPTGGSPGNLRNPPGGMGRPRPPYFRHSHTKSSALEILRVSFNCGCAPCRQPALGIRWRCVFWGVRLGSPGPRNRKTLMVHMCKTFCKFHRSPQIYRSNQNGNENQQTSLSARRIRRGK